MNYTADIAIIGGGACGLAAAITAKKAAPQKNVYIFEALDRVGKKLATTGNGRCNITNRHINIRNYHGEDTAFAEYALKKYDNSVLERFFEEIGIQLVFEGDKAFPASLQASSVVDCLRFECERIGVKTMCGFKVEKIKAGKDFVLFSDRHRVFAKAVICCTGLYAGGERLGSDGSFYRTLKDIGFKTVKTSPSIVQLKTETEYVKQLKGIKTDAKATLLKNGKTVKSEMGEVLFCDYGLSGPAVMNISRDALRTEGEFSVSLDLLPNMSETELAEMIYSRIRNLKQRNLDEFFTGMLNKRLSQVVLKYCGYKLSNSVSTLNKNDALKIATALKNFEHKVTGNTGDINSQVTAGGISTNEFYKDTLMSKRFAGLFACGELLDIDGDCGGFNLAWAWASGMLAAEQAVKYIGETKC